MNFSSLLTEYLSNRKLDDIVQVCAERGVRVDAPFLSRMRSGTRLPPADDQAVRVIAEACGRDPEPLVLLAKYERDPHQVMEMVIDHFVQLRRAASSTIEEFMIERAVVLAAIETGENPAAIKGRLDEQTEQTNKVLEAYTDQDRAMLGMVELLSDTERLEYAEAGTYGTLASPRPRPLPALVEDLARSVAIPAESLWAFLAALKITREPHRRLDEVMQDLKSSEQSTADDTREAQG